MSEQESKLYALYQAVHLMMARLGADGEIDTRAPEVDAVMDAMHEYDGGQYIQWNTPQPVTPAGGEVGDDARFEWLGKQMRSCTTYMDGSRAFDAASFAMRKHNLRGRTIREAIDAAMSEDAALNQRGD